VFWLQRIDKEKKKKKCDALPVEKKEAILKEKENIEKNYHIQLERIRKRKGCLW